MSFAGTVFDMIRRSEANRAMLRSRYGNAADLRQRYINHSHRRGLLADMEISPEELQRIKGEIRRQIRRERIRANVLAIIAGTFAAAALAVVMLFVLGKIKA